MDIEEIIRMRNRDIDFQKSIEVKEDINFTQWIYLEGRISALSDVLLQYYFENKISDPPVLNLKEM